MNAQIDVRHVLASVRVPALVLHRVGDHCLHVEEGRYLASLIPGAEFIELPGNDHLPFAGDQDAILAAIERFLARNRVRRSTERVLGTVLTLEPPVPVEDGFGSIYEREVAWYRGILLPPAGGFNAIFDGPARAVQCACAVADASHVGLRAGVHIGEVDLRAPDGPVVAISRQLARTARPGDVLVSRSVVDLVPGSGLHFDERGTVRPDGSDRDVTVLALRRTA
jgi:hypothetical protein